MAVFHERVTGRGGDATDTTVLVVCGLGAGAVPACYVLRGGARRRFTPHFP